MKIRLINSQHSTESLCTYQMLQVLWTNIVVSQFWDNTVTLYSSPPLIRTLPLKAIPLIRTPPLKAIPLIKDPPTKGHSSYQVRFQMHWDSKLLLQCPLQIDHLSYKIVNYYYNAPLQIDHLSYKIVNYYYNVPLQIDHLSYTTTFSL